MLSIVCILLFSFIQPATAKNLPSPYVSSTLQNQTAQDQLTGESPVAPIFEDVPVSLVATGNGAVAWGDYDQDGDLDIIITGCRTGCVDGTAKIYRNDGGSHFVDIEASLTGGYFGSVEWSDYDVDGDLDVVVTACVQGDPCNIATADIYRNDDGSFVDIQAPLMGIYGSGAAWGDYDGDQDPDLVIAGWAPTGGRIARLYRNDSGVFVDVNASLIGVSNAALAWGDYDLDQDLDLLLTGSTASGQVTQLYQNDGGTLQPVATGLIPVQEGSVAWGDYEQDGDPDILLMGSPDWSQTQVAKIYRNEGEGVFSEVHAGLQGVRLGTATWVDYDNDGDLDVFLSGWNGTAGSTILYRNDGNNQFADANASLIGTYYTRSDWGDYDNDGDIDLLHIGCTSGAPCIEFVTKVYRNTAVLNASTAEAGGPYLVAVGNSISLDGSGSSDADGDALVYEWTATGGTINGSTFVASNQAGIFEVTLTVSDPGGLSATDTAMLVIYDPSGGFVTGGGWIWSEAGSCQLEPDICANAVGKANFGFVSKYKKGAPVPTGNTQFQFEAGNLNFHSNVQEWLVVNQGGTNAQFKGAGTLNGQNHESGVPYKFMIWAGDGAPDTFRIRIWWEDAQAVEHVVYDNGTDQALGGGSVVIHKGAKSASVSGAATEAQLLFVPLIGN